MNKSSQCTWGNRVADSDLPLRGEEDSHPYPEKRGGPVSKNFFLALWASVWSKNEGETGPQGPSPGSATGIQDSLGFWIPHCGFWKYRYWILNSLSVGLGFRIPTIHGILDSGFQNPVFRIPQVKISPILHFTSKNLWECGFSYMGKTKGGWRSRCTYHKRNLQQWRQLILIFNWCSRMHLQKIKKITYFTLTMPVPLWSDVLIITLLHANT